MSDRDELKAALRRCGEALAFGSQSQTDESGLILSALLNGTEASPNYVLSAAIEVIAELLCDAAELAE